MSRSLIATTLAVATLLAVSSCSSTHAKPAASARPDPKATTTAERVSVWWNSTGKAYDQVLNKDLVPLEKPSPTYEAASEACSQLVVDLSHAQQDTPVPDPTAQAQWAAALHAWDRAMTDCEVSTDEHNPSLFDKSHSEITTAASDFFNALQAITRIAHGG